MTNTNNSRKAREQWKDIEGFEGRYQVSNLGNVRSLNYNKKGVPGNLTLLLNKKTGYVQVQLYKDGRSHIKYVHRLVAAAFIPNPNNLEQVDHINNKRSDNMKSNLRWVSRKFNNSRPHARKMKSCNSRHESRSHLAVRGESDGVVRYFKNARHASSSIGCPHPSVIKVLRGEFKQTHGWTFKYIPRDSEEARNSGVEFRSRTELGTTPSNLRHIENKKDRKRIKEERKLKFQHMKVELLMDYHSRQIGAEETRDRLNKLAHDFKAIVQKTLDGKFIREWRNTYAAQKELGIRGLYDAVRTGEPAGNYKWEWKIN